MPDRDEETSLVRRVRSGDESAFEVVVRRFGGRMLAVAGRLLRNPEDARDAVQEAFLSAFKSIEGFEAQASLGPWLHRIVVNAALMKVRSRRREPDGVVSIEELLPQFEPDGHRRNPRTAWQTPDQTPAERCETGEMVRRKIDLLPEDSRMVLMLRDIEGLDTQETAKLLGITPGAVKTRLHRARMALRELLERELS